MIRNGICLALFFVVLAIGLFVDAQAIDRTELFGWPLFVASKTVTNLALVTFVCSFMGHGSMIDCTLRGLVIYLAAMIGTVGIFTDAMLVNTSPETYSKVAGLIGFVAIKVAIENPPVGEWIKSFAIPTTKGPT